MAYEVKSVLTSGLTKFREADRNRVNVYLTRVESYFTWVVSQPETDSPQTHPLVYPVRYLSNQETGPDDQPIIQDPENKGLRAVVRLMRVWMAEMAKSSSRRMPNGLSEPDQTRFKDHLTKIRSFLADYIDNVQPVDLPESNPSSPLTGQGYT